MEGGRATTCKLSLFIAWLAISLFALAWPVSAQAANFVADLSGSQAVPPIKTVATGQATFQVNPDGPAITFVLTAFNIENVSAVHIHCAGETQNGPVGVTLSGGAPGAVNGTFAQGTITAPDPGNSCGWADFAGMIGAITSGNTYVNVHTAANPAGEIRGQIR